MSAEDDHDAEGYAFYATEALAWAELGRHQLSEQQPRTRKLRDFRRHGSTGCRCEWCVPAKKAGFKASMRRMWKRDEDTTTEVGSR